MNKAPENFLRVTVLVQSPSDSSQCIDQITSFDSYTRHGNLIDTPLVACWDCVGRMLLLAIPLLILPITTVIVYESIFSERYEMISWMQSICIIPIILDIRYSQPPVDEFQAVVWWSVTAKKAIPGVTDGEKLTESSSGGKRDDFS